MGVARFRACRGAAAPQRQRPDRWAARRPGRAVTTVDQFIPPVFPNAYPTASAASHQRTQSPRRAHSGSAVRSATTVSHSSRAAAHPTPSGTFRPAIRTDKDDYIPGQTVVMSGDGWLPGETVTLLLQENPQVHEDRRFTAVADAMWPHHEQRVRHRECIASASSSPSTASGDASRAQTQFMDARQLQGFISPSAAQTGVAGTYTLTVVNFEQRQARPLIAWSSTFRAGRARRAGALSVVATNPGPATLHLEHASRSGQPDYHDTGMGG